MASSLQVYSGFNAGILKEPLGFIKPIQWVLSIFAFATTTAPVLQFSFEASCAPLSVNSTTNEPVKKKPFSFSVSYPFRLDDKSLSSPYVCNGSVNQNLLEAGHASSGFYVFVGVIVFLYCMVALAFYLLCGEYYRSRSACAIADFVISGVIVILWLAGSSAWAQGVQDLKFYTNLCDCGFLDLLPDCISPDCKLSNCKSSACEFPNLCHQDTMPNFGSLNVSIIFGFLNMCVWVGNMWFIFKETPWKRNDSPPKAGNNFGAGPSSKTPVEQGRI